MEYNVCVTQDSGRGIMLIAATGSVNTGEPVAVVRNITVTDSACVYLPPADGKHILTKHFTRTGSFRLVY
jgi:hypothetical protein